MKLTPPLKWHGGKSYLAKKIVALVPDHTHYVEPYFGGGAVLLAKDPEGVSEVVNDVHKDLTTFWKVLQRPADFYAFERVVQAVPFSEEEWKYADTDHDRCPSNVEIAVDFFIRCRQSLSGRMDGFAPLSKARTRRGMNEQVAAWLGAVEGLPAVHSRLKRVVILNREATDVIRQQDGPGTLFYCDPPYLHSTRASTDTYAYEMTRSQHKFLLAQLSAVAGKFILSGYPSKLYARFAGRHGWNRREFDLPNNAAGGARKRRVKECVWTNF